ncbi:MAG: TetR/AcrR family transcriptional regulator C-terminal domain-containing protein [Clostridia bacterium]|nr:TetR/AcrR family transcriptional regulator C-terminal domain-containing protein [Clostridia bacterium]
MQKDTKKAISDTFVTLLESKSFDKITVKDIVETCGINRNTFYYYYSDIYDLLEEIFRRELDLVVEQHRAGKSWVEGFLCMAKVAYGHKRLIRNIISSRSYDYWLSYMIKSCKYILVDFVTSEAAGMQVPEADIDFIATFYEHAFAGIITDWFRQGMQETPEEYAGQIWLVVGSIRRALERSQQRYLERNAHDPV